MPFFKRNKKAKKDDKDSAKKDDKASCKKGDKVSAIKADKALPKNDLPIVAKQDSPVMAKQDLHPLPQAQVKHEVEPWVKHKVERWVKHEVERSVMPEWEPPVMHKPKPSTMRDSEEENYGRLQVQAMDVDNNDYGRLVSTAVEDDYEDDYLDYIALDYEPLFATGPAGQLIGNGLSTVPLGNKCNFASKAVNRGSQEMGDVKRTKDEQRRYIMLFTKKPMYLDILQTPMGYCNIYMLDLSVIQNEIDQLFQFAIAGKDLLTGDDLSDKKRGMCSLSFYEYGVERRTAFQYCLQKGKYLSINTKRFPVKDSEYCIGAMVSSHMEGILQCNSEYEQAKCLQVKIKSLKQKGIWLKCQSGITLESESLHVNAAASSDTGLYRADTGTELQVFDVQLFNDQLHDISQLVTALAEEYRTHVDDNTTVKMFPIKRFLPLKRKIEYLRELCTCRFMFNSSAEYITALDSIEHPGVIEILFLQHMSVYESLVDVLTDGNLIMSELLLGSYF